VGGHVVPNAGPNGLRFGLTVRYPVHLGTLPLKLGYDGV
jgi:hypothetical protein